MRIEWAKFTTYEPSRQQQCSSSELPVRKDLSVHVDASEHLARNTQLID